MVSAKEAEHILRDVRDSHGFRLHMGTNIRNLKTLREALDIMSERTFHHHVTHTRNDFSEWIDKVLDDEELAKHVSHLKTKDSISKRLHHRVEELEEKLAESHVTTKELMSIGAVDFVIGMIVGFIGGLIIAAMVAI